MGLSIRLLTFSRGYATKPGGSRLKPTLSLDQFIQRGRVLAFYRTILRGTKKIADPTTRAESRKYARDEFERRRNVTDAVCFPHSLLGPFTDCSLQVTCSVPPLNWKDGMGRHGEVYRWYVAQQL
ncbi:hypothetical protein CEK27_001342 [Fusarium fujikuroi]|uniref:Complex 1 LYR protein domain-containing protein n=1 Tax=Fusarium fujikuroi TaxID=5127 RepID=A0A9Q9RIU6_FUSFU|nr:hypothetical protein CEK27_001342 [Fusarium fujikuroi]VTT65054.1 unnamed protein product [Fusarium fujikuroi]VTT75300.1 unnamed protein product [Fusarium fujikuroi]